MHLKKIAFQHRDYPSDSHYPFNLPIFRNTKEIVFHTPITFFVGENGTGKSTLLEALARKCGIHMWQTADKRKRLVANPYETRLPDHVSIQWINGRVPGSYFGSSLFQDFVHLLDEWAATDPGQLDYFGGQSLATQSHGQSIMAFFKARYTIKGLYLLDEPETALSPKSQINLLNLLPKAAKGGKAQFIIATHSPILLAAPGAKILSFDGPAIMGLDYEKTVHYKLYRRFMTDPRKFIEE